MSMVVCVGPLCRYDCVYPTRTARFGVALVPEGVLKLKVRPSPRTHTRPSGAFSLLVLHHYGLFRAFDR
jgi:hypothetical protein